MNALTYRYNYPDETDGTPVCQHHVVRMVYSHPFEVDGKTIHLWVCPFDAGHVEFRGHGDNDTSAAEMVAA